MGAALSAAGDERLGLGDLPESCIAAIVSRLEPPEICQLAQLNRAFWRASTADLVWETKLPSNFGFLARRVFEESTLTKKDLYARLCRSLPFDAGSKQVWVDKRSGMMCLSLSWKALTITGIHDRRYWNHIYSDESRFHTIAYLRQIWWVEVCGDLEFSFPEGSYGLFFRLQIGKAARGRLGRRVCDLEHVHGWNLKPVKFELSTSHGQHAVSQCYLGQAGNWVLYHVGDFVVGGSDKLTNIKFSMTQIDCTHTKGGLCLDSVLIYPNDLGTRLKALTHPDKLASE